MQSAKEAKTEHFFIAYFFHNIFYSITFFIVLVLKIILEMCLMQEVHTYCKS